MSIRKAIINKRSTAAKKPVRVLSIDAGGIRSPVIASVILRELEEKLGKKAKDVFDIFIGTSGGSLVAASSCMGMAGKDILKASIEMGKNSFQRGFLHRVKTANGILGPKYRSEGLVESLSETFGEKAITDLEKPLCIPITDLKANRSVVVKSHEDKEPYDYRLQKLVDVLYASSAAPTYFDFLFDRYADGGIFAYNPAMSGYAEAKNLWPDRKVQILSVGSGKTEAPSKVPNRNPKALLKKLVEGALESQAGSVSWMVRRIPDATLWRINPYTKSALDDTSKENILNLIAIAEDWFPVVSEFCDAI